MTVIGGIITPNTALRRSAASVLLSQLGKFGRHYQRLAETETACFVGALHRTLPEDAFDQQPLTARSHQLLFAADCRIDCRDEVCRALEIPAAKRSRLSDAELLFRAWQRFGPASLDRLTGDYAFAIWSENNRELYIARSPFGYKPLFVSEFPGGIAFATAPWALLHVLEDNDALNEDFLAALICNVALEGSGTPYAKVSRVLPGHLLHWRDGQTRSIQFWSPAIDILANRSLDELADELSNLMTNAVESRLRADSGDISSQLSAGRDSSAVAAVAAQLLAQRGKRLIALTGAPRANYALRAGFPLLADEGALAASTAAIHSNIDHYVCRPSGTFSTHQLDELHRFNQWPVGILSNVPWQLAVAQEAQKQGATVLLNGQAGNSTISLGGTAFSKDVLREEGPFSWLFNVARAHRGHPRSTAGELRRLLASKHVGLSRADVSRRTAIVAPSFRGDLEQRLRDYSSRFSSGTARQQTRLRMIAQDQATLHSLPLWGLDTRDPTADQRLAEFCLRVPAEKLGAFGTSRPLYEKTFAGLINSRTLRGRVSGYQGADWHHSFPRDMISAELRTAKSDPIMRGLLDWPVIEQVLERWPAGGWEESSVYLTYRMQLLTAFSVASFLRVMPQLPKKPAGGKSEDSERPAGKH